MLLVSELLTEELLNAPPEVRELLASLPKGCVEAVAESFEAERLRNEYLEARVVGPASENDAHHVALATVAGADMIVSWNFRHTVHFEKIRGFNAVNLLEGYASMEIRCPTEVV